MTMTINKNNSARRDGYNQKLYDNNFDKIFGSEKERKQREDENKKEKYKHAAASSKSAYIMKSIDPFKSNVDGSIISDHKQLKEHNKRNGVTNSADYSESYMNNRRNSIASSQERDNKIQRIDALKHVMRTKGYE
jgi:hypothetical protein